MTAIAIIVAALLLGHDISKAIDTEERMTDGQLISKRRKDMTAWAVKNFKVWPKPYEITDADPEEIGCELAVLNQHHLPVLRCKLGGGYVDSTTWFYAKRNPKK